MATPTPPKRKLDVTALVALGIMVLIAIWLVFGQAVWGLPEPQSLIASGLV